jgi:hypothetical protein
VDFCHRQGLRVQIVVAKTTRYSPWSAASACHLSEYPSPDGALLSRHGTRFCHGARRPDTGEKSRTACPASAGLVERGAPSGGRLAGRVGYAAALLQAWSHAPLPPALHALLDAGGSGQALHLYAPP